MQRRRLALTQRFEVRARAVALVSGQLEPGVAQVQSFHHRVPARLRENRRRADRSDTGVAVHDRLNRAAEAQILDARQLVTVHLHVCRAHGQAQQRASHGEKRRA